MCSIAPTNARYITNVCLACFACWGGGGIPTSIPTKLFHGPGRVRWAAKFPRSSGTTHQKISLSRERGGLGREIPRALRGPPSEDFTAQGGNVGGKFPQCFGATGPKKRFHGARRGPCPAQFPEHFGVSHLRGRARRAVHTVSRAHPNPTPLPFPASVLPQRAHPNPTPLPFPASVLLQPART